jgi:hypothetical protein
MKDTIEITRLGEIGDLSAIIAQIQRLRELYGDDAPDIIEWAVYSAGTSWMSGGAGDDAEMLTIVCREFKDVLDRYPGLDREWADHLSYVKYWQNIHVPNRPNCLMT